MSKPLFDPFGEPVPAAERSLASDRTTKWLKSAGTGLFWARAVYFEPGNFSFERAMAWIQGLMAVFQGSSV
jgi:hypothetical protein